MIRLVMSNSGTREDGEDIFQRCILAIVEKAQNDSLSLRAKVSTYIYQVCRNLWLNELRNRGIRPQLTMINDEVLTNISAHVEEIVLQDRRNNEAILFHEKFSLLGDKCQSILSLFFQNISLPDIAEQLGYEYGSVRTTKTNCVKKLTSLIQNDQRFDELN